ncbi:NAD(P)-dependent oxidoreductase [Subtercola lobariae]|uniref:2-hydroxy-3-oxopropionate reductase n=1 Tax=Subtercola lobariae TaxID=1588641 RepID=A0A917B1G6_9MICO|nr:NAD(P)-dependent oxidoreductase [Subtercola lobariae]GGF11800.1 2-hydroxy-3-oxopropionate reductase [Subtercola lobariae]
MTAPIGFVGAGVMGSHIVRRLLGAGIDVLVFARSPEKAADLIAAGAECTADLREVGERCDIVLGCLLDDPAVDSVYLGAPGSRSEIGNTADAAGGPAKPFALVSNGRSGQVFIEHGTFSPGLARRIARVAADRGARFIDAPVTGGPEGAADGTLVIMAGAGVAGAGVASAGVAGAAEAGAGVAAAAGASAAEAAPTTSALSQHVLDLFAVYSRETHVTGQVGTGAELKLVNQLLVSVHMAAAAEAAALLRASGVDAAVATAVLGAGWAASTMLTRELPLALRGDFANRGASIGGLIHVQTMIAAAFADAGVSARLLPTTVALFADATQAGLGDSDPAALIELYRADASAGAAATASAAEATGARGEAAAKPRAEAETSATPAGVRP